MPVEVMVTCPGRLLLVDIDLVAMQFVSTIWKIPKLAVAVIGFLGKKCATSVNTSLTGRGLSTKI